MKTITKGQEKMFVMQRDKVTRRPTHPGAVLREDVLPDLGISVTEFARVILTSRQTLHKILNEQKGLTPLMATKICRFIGGNPAVWLRMQQNYDLYEVKQRYADDLNQIRSCCG